MFRAWPVIGAALVLTAAAASAALAQDKPDAEPSSYKGLSAADLRAAFCIYNDKLFSKGAEICVRKGVAIKCEGGTWAPIPNSCLSAPDAHPAF